MKNCLRHNIGMELSINAMNNNIMNSIIQGPEQEYGYQQRTKGMHHFTPMIH